MSASSRARSRVSAVDGAVVSKPTAKNTTSPVRVLHGQAQRVERRVHEADVGAARLGLEQVAVAAGHAHHVAEGGEDHARVLGHGDGVVDAAHRDHADRAAGAVHQLDALGQHVLDAVAVDGVGVAAAHLHELERVAGGQLGDVAHDGAGGDRVAVLVDEAHVSRPGPGRRPRVDASRAASSSV